jgi:hypothetical protein
MLFIVNRPDQPLQPAASAALVTLALGDAHRDVWHRVARPSWEVYAQRHGMDLIAICAPVDSSDFAQQRSPAWQKCLVLSQPWAQFYQRIVWIDADIVINTEAPSILDHCGPPPLVSAVLVNDQLSPAQKHILLERIGGVTISPSDAERHWEKAQNLVYTTHGISTHLTEMVATGVMVFSPAHHRDLLEQVYQLPGFGPTYEQPGLSHRILTQGLLHRLSARFNWGLWDALWLNRKGQFGTSDEDLFIFIRNELEKSYFLHFAEVFEMMKGLVVVPSPNTD